MSWAWSRTFYAQKDGRIFNFEAKRNRDDAVRNHGFEAIKSYDAWKHYPNITRIGWREYQKWILTIKNWNDFKDDWRRNDSKGIFDKGKDARPGTDRA